jgi:hypothetical protein
LGICTFPVRSVTCSSCFRSSCPILSKKQAEGNKGPAIALQPHPKSTLKRFVEDGSSEDDEQDEEKNPLTVVDDGGNLINEDGDGEETPKDEIDLE